MIERGNELLRKQMDEDYENSKKKEDSNVLRDSLDSRLMLAKALKAGSKAIRAQSITKLSFTATDKSNPAHAMATAFASFNQVKDAIQIV